LVAVVEPKHLFAGKGYQKRLLGGDFRIAEIVGQKRPRKIVPGMRGSVTRSFTRAAVQGKITNAGVVSTSMGSAARDQRKKVTIRSAKKGYYEAENAKRG